MIATGFAMFWGMTLWADLGVFFTPGNPRLSAFFCRRFWWVGLVPTLVALQALITSGSWSAAGVAVVALSCVVFALVRLRPRWEGAGPQLGADDRYWMRVRWSLLTWLLIWASFFLL